ncbi:hypothetical protein K2173_009119 [Erythroxylum novogranatense]|uniref:Uncharacterized protein n=1 Tax=Erythroxylum novogranatense TaxID=1862640 RepID=A0AAV8TJ14_9ROSI|nr:hypothetical protein K2173_009119 [Erythroxylum novogranatense]
MDIRCLTSALPEGSRFVRTKILLQTSRTSHILLFEQLPSLPLDALQVRKHTPVVMFYQMSLSAWHWPWLQRIAR